MTEIKKLSGLAERAGLDLFAFVKPQPEESANE